MTDDHAPAGAQDVRASDEELIRQLGQAMADADAKMGATLVGYAFLREVQRALREKPAPHPQPDRAALVERFERLGRQAGAAAGWETGENRAWNSGYAQACRHAAEMLSDAEQPPSGGTAWPNAPTDATDLVTELERRLSDAERRGGFVALSHATAAKILDRTAPNAGGRPALHPRTSGRRGRWRWTIGSRAALSRQSMRTRTG